MVQDIAPTGLGWSDVDPARHPFDRACAADVVNSLEPARNVPARPARTAADRRSSARGERASSWADAMSSALADRYGRWALGWRWARGEGDFDGGPVTAWCCVSHSMTDRQETLARVARAVCEWRDWLTELADAFEAHPVDPADIAGQRIRWQRAAQELVIRVAQRTACESGWYDHCEQVLTWYLQRWQVEPGTAAAVVAETVAGRFESWTQPDPALVADVAERFARALAPAGEVPATGAVPDHLQQWLAVREQVPWGQVDPGNAAGPRRPTRDGALGHVRAVDAVVDPARGRGLLAALELVRADAERGAALDFDLLQGWQRHVLGVADPAFRTEPAFAKGGRERYGIGPDTARRFDACLAQSTAFPPLPLAARAARAYLDVCFFHPFDDGNARSALLTAVFVLAREGVVPEHVDLLRGLAVRADDPQDALWLARAVAVHIAGP